MEQIFVVDASGYLYRSYFAIQNITNLKGESTNALFGFIRSLLKLIKDFQPQHCVAVFDGPDNAASRKAIYTDYKAHRASMPEDLRYQIDWAREFCDLIGIPQLHLSGVEADDTMGSVAVWAAHQGSRVLLCTSDKDLYQFVNGHIQILNTFKDNLVIDRKGVEEQFGIPPELMIDYLAITGDASDNIPGLSGFGPKTAASLLKQFGSLDALIANAGSLTGKKRETLLQEGEKALLSRQLVVINTSLDIPKQEDFYRLKTPDNPLLKAFYTRMNFASLLKGMAETEQTEKNAALVDKEEKSTDEPLYVLVDDEKAFQLLIDTLEQQKEVCLALEMTTEQLDAEIVGVAFCYEEGIAWYIPFNGHLENLWGTPGLMEKLRPLLEDPKKAFYGHSIKGPYRLLLHRGVELSHISFDTMLASYILSSHSRQHSLEHLMLEYEEKVKISAASLQGKGKHELSMRNVEIAKVAAYCCEGVDYTCRLKKRFVALISERQLDYLFYSIEMPLLPILAKMELKGIYLNIPYLKQMSQEVATLIHKLEEDIYQLAGERFNINSPQQLSGILFGKMGIKPRKKTATGHSTNADVLEELKREHPIAEKLLEYRTIEKLRSTYIDALPTQVNPQTHRIHCNFNQSVAATGRLSSQNPNLQNIPVRSDIGRKIRTAFCPEKTGWSYLSADYSQIELRLLAHLSEDPVLIHAFNHNEDVHAHTASAIFNVPLDQVTKAQRHQAKAVNFGIIYGQQAYGLSQELGIEVKMAAAFIETYFTKFKRVKEFVEECKCTACVAGKAVTLTGRERLIPEIGSKNEVLRNAAERLAVNTPLQGAAADLIKLAMIRLDQALIAHQQERGEEWGYMVLQIHDELLFEVPDTALKAVEALVRREMEGVWQLKVPLTIDVSIGKNWEEC